MKTIIFLYVIIFGYDSHPKTQLRVEMPDFKTCFESVQKHESKISNGNEAESGIIIFCGTSNAQICNSYTDGTYKCESDKKR